MKYNKWPLQSDAEQVAERLDIGVDCDAIDCAREIIFKFDMFMEVVSALRKLREDAYDGYADSSCNDALALADKVLDQVDAFD